MCSTHESIMQGPPCWLGACRTLSEFIGHKCGALQAEGGPSDSELDERIAAMLHVMQQNAKRGNVWAEVNSSVSLIQPHGCSYSACSK